MAWLLAKPLRPALVSWRLGRGLWLGDDPRRELQEWFMMIMAMEKVRMNKICGIIIIVIVHGHICIIVPTTACWTAKLSNRIWEAWEASMSSCRLSLSLARFLAKPCALTTCTSNFRCGGGNEGRIATYPLHLIMLVSPNIPKQLAELVRARVS